VNAADNIAIRDSALSLIGLPSGIGRTKVAISTCVLSTRDPDEGMRVNIGRVLGERAMTAMSDSLGNRIPVGVVDARVRSSDEASCKDLTEGRVRSAFIEGERCYRLYLRICAC
jgi:hypothetical protein